MNRFWRMLRNLLPTSRGSSQTPFTADAQRWRAQLIMRRTIALLVLITFAGVAALVFYVRALPKAGHAFALLSLISGAALLVGALAGFLFGVPRTLQGEVTDKTKRTYQVNTNLEQISDWLTKIIVGITLVNLKAIPETIQEMNRYLGPSIALGRGAEVIVGSAVVYFAVAGFFWGYLGTRLYLAGAIPWADDAGNVPALLDAAKGPVDKASNQDPLKPPATQGASAATAPEVKNVVQAIDATDPDPTSLSVDDARTIALSYYLSDRYSDAVRYFEAANKNPSADPQFTMQHAIALGESGRRDRAVALLERLARERVGGANVYQLLGYYMLWLPDRLEDAIRYNQQYLDAIGVDDGGTHLNMAAAYGDLYAEAKKRAPEKAQEYLRHTVEELQKAVSIDPEWRELATNLRNRNENFTALSNEDFNRAISIPGS